MRKWILIAVVGTIATLALPSWGGPVVRSFEGMTIRHEASVRITTRELEEALITEASSLSRREQLALYLGDTGAGDAVRLSLKARVRRLLHDPAVALHFTSIRDEWFRGALTEWTTGGPLFESTREFVECKIMIARNLYFRGLAPSAENVKDEYGRIQRLRHRYGEMEIFSDRNVVFAASNDHTEDGNSVFGGPPTVRRLGRRANSMILLKGDGTERPARTRERLAENLSTFENLTFVFEGHGRERLMKFAGGLAPITVVSHLVERPSRESNLQISTPWSVIIINACQAHTFSRELLDLYRQVYPNRQLPVVIVPVEFGDDLIKRLYNDPFFTSELRLAYRTDTHLGALFSKMKATTSVYVPDEDNVLTQIS